MGLFEIFAFLAVGALKLAALVGVVFLGTRLALWSHDRGKRSGSAG